MTSDTCEKTPGDPESFILVPWTAEVHFNNKDR